jgi:hypothetical protein
MKKILLLSICILFVLFAAVANVAQASSSATVTSTVTVQSVSVSVSSGTVSYGTIAANTSEDTTASGLDDTQTVTNNGNVAEDFAIQGQDSADWTLGSTPGVNTYEQQFCTTSCTSPPTNYTALTTSNQSLASSVGATDTASLDLRITTPTSSTSTTSESVNVTILASAS